ncbi:MAG: hypothetical protein HY778_05160 [Betaproteobacteria bacterium]|nr:hypothetical protein [Betaproteobacteria bacterium]
MESPTPSLPPAGKAGGVPADADIRALDAGRPVEWLKFGWAMFLKNPVIWIAIMAILLAINIVLNFVPVLGGIAAAILAPIFGGGLMLAVRSLDEGGDLRVDHLFAGFRGNAQELGILGLLYLAGLAVMVVLGMVVGGGAAMSGAILGGGHSMGMGVGGAAMGAVVMMLLMLVLVVLLFMSISFAPALVVFRGVAPVDAVKASFAAWRKNLGPLLLTTLFVLVLGIVATLTFGLGWLVLGPVLVGAGYAAYVDVFA